MGNQITTLRMGQEKKRTPVGDIPIDWGLAAIGEIAEVNPEVLREDTPPNATFRYIDISSIERPGIISSAREVTFTTAPSRARRIVKRGDILISTVRPYLRAFALVTSTETNLIASTGFAVIRPKSGIEGEYLWQYVLSDAFVKFLESRMTGSNYPAVNPSDVAEASIPIPPLPEQRKIAGILSALSNSVAMTHAVLKTLKIIRAAVLGQIFERNEHKKKKAGGWKMLPLIEVATLQRGIDLPVQSRSTGDVPVYGSNGVLGFHNKTEFQGPGVITGRSGTIGKVYFSEGSYWPLNTTLHVVDFHGNNPRFIALLLSYLRLERFSASTGVPSLNRNFVHPISVAVPSLVEQSRIVEISSHIDELIDKEGAELAAQTSLCRALMQKLFDGTLRARESTG